MPLPTDVGFEPGCKVARRIRQGCTDITQIAGAVTGRYVQGAAEGDGQMGIIAAYAALVVIGFRSPARDPRVLVAESDAFMGLSIAGLQLSLGSLQDRKL